MKKNGFTLIELMAVIFILGIVMTLIIVSVDKTIKDNKESLYEAQIANIEDATRTWGNAHINLIPDENGDAISIPLMILKQDGLVDRNLKNPKTEEPFFDNMYIDISYENGQYIYDVIEDSGTQVYSDLDYSVIILKEKFKVSEFKEDIEVLIFTSDKQILNNTLAQVEDSTNSLLTIAYTEENKTFIVARKRSMCVLVSGSKFAVGSEYECDPGDGIKRTFFVIEDGDTTKLTKTDGSAHYNGDGVGTADKGEISLIMNDNIGTSAFVTKEEYKATGEECFDGSIIANDKWCATGLVGPITANAYLKEETIDNGWRTEVYLPTYDQIYAVNNSDNLTNLNWLHPLDEKGYWTSTTARPGDDDVLYPWSVCMVSLKTYTDGDKVLLEAGTWYGTTVEDKISVRPVITISKDDIN